MSTTLVKMVRDQVLAEGLDIASEQDWTDQNHLNTACDEYVDAELNRMSNVELLERISDALQRATNMPVRPWL